MDGGAHSVSATRAALHPELALQRYDAHSFHRLSRATRVLRRTDDNRGASRKNALEIATSSAPYLPLGKSVRNTTKLSWADLSRADLSKAEFSATLFVDSTLADAKGLDSVDHRGPSTLPPSRV